VTYQRFSVCACA